jgi:CubicO group peptidase (beta-lactamase class C family)
MKPSLLSLLTLLHCSLCVTVTPTPTTSNPRQHVLSYTPSSASATTTTATASATATSTSSTVPVDPYFTNGVQQVWRDDGTLLFQNTFGFKSRTYDVPISLDNRFRVGSNTKLYTAVCIYQLHEKGLLNVTDSVSDYLDQSDFVLFGFPNQTTWCPQIHGGDGSCQSITFVQLMAMR